MDFSWATQAKKLHGALLSIDYQWLKHPLDAGLVRIGPLLNLFSKWLAKK
jgi:hypothetical protein